jgi:O-antigen chain-terminating methyltransferase
VAANIPSLSPIDELLLSKVVHRSEWYRQLRRWILYRLLYPSHAFSTTIARKFSLLGGLARSFNVSERQWNAFYHDFELRFRGDSQVIAERLRSRYRDKIAEVAREQQTPLALDLGCGSGEFLDLSRSQGFATLGVDLSPQAVEVCRSKGHYAYRKDILAYLRTLKDCSISLVGLFHVIEHCSPRYMLAVFREVSRVLVPAGMFIVETPSLYSLWSSVRQFYLDPTHLRPVHPDYIIFMLEYCQMKHQETLTSAEVAHPQRPCWQEQGGEQHAHSIAQFKKLEDWLYGPMDLAVIARR